MSVHEKFRENGFMYNGPNGSMSKRGNHKLDKLIENAYVKFYPMETEIYKQTKDSWNYLRLDSAYNIISEETLTEEEVLNK